MCLFRWLWRKCLEIKQPGTGSEGGSWSISMTTCIWRQPAMKGSLNYKKSVQKNKIQDYAGQWKVQKSDVLENWQLLNFLATQELDFLKLDFTSESVVFLVLRINSGLFPYFQRLHGFPWGSGGGPDNQATCQHLQRSEPINHYSPPIIIGVHQFVITVHPFILLFPSVSYCPPIFQYCLPIYINVVQEFKSGLSFHQFNIKYQLISDW